MSADRKLRIPESYEVAPEKLAPQTMLEPKAASEAIDVVFERVLARVPLGPTEIEMKFGTKGRILITNDGQSASKISGHFREPDGQRATFFSLTRPQTGQTDTGKMVVRRYLAPATTPERYLASVEGSRLLGNALDGLFIGDIGGPEAYDQLSTTRSAVAQLQDSAGIGKDTPIGLGD